MSRRGATDFSVGPFIGLSECGRSTDPPSPHQTTFIWCNVPPTAEDGWPSGSCRWARRGRDPGRLESVKLTFPSSETTPGYDETRSRRRSTTAQVW